MFSKIINHRLFKEVSLGLGAVVLAVIIANVLPVDVMAQGLSNQLDDSSIPPSLRGNNGDIRGFVIGVIEFLLGFLGLVAVVLIIYAGFLYLTDAGSEESVGKAKKILLYSVIGLVIIFASFAIVRFAFNIGEAGVSGGNISPAVNSTAPPAAF